MHRSHIFYFLTVIVAFSYANKVVDFFEDTASYALFGESASDVEEKVKKVVNSVKTFYEEHKTIILAGEVLLLAGTGLGEAGLLDMVVDVYEAGGVDALLQGAADVTVEAASSVRSFASGMFEAIKSVKALPSYGTMVEAGKAGLDLLGPWIEKFATETVLEKFPLVTAQLLVLFANSIIASIVKSDKPELACKMENVLRDNMKDAVNARLAKLQPPPEYDNVLSFIQEVRAVQYLPYNKDGYNPTKQLRCDKGSKCFVDKFKKGSDKKICTSSSNCYRDYAGQVRHTIEKTYPIEIYEKTCNNKITQDKIDGESRGYWAIHFKYIVVESSLVTLRPIFDLSLDDGKGNVQTKRVDYSEITMNGRITSSIKSIKLDYEFPNAVNKKQAKVKITVTDNGRIYNSLEDEFTIEGNVYNLQRNGLKPKDPNNFIEVYYSWRNAPAPK